ncbi:histidine phosphatase family protein [Agrobacterium tumefaciens]|uniref:histidine phosphatase family protein n=1 Tax=Rhizobium/Agrobacterium group TaxID=227290 RepID=UPI000BCCB476|nr:MULTISPECIES: histidine phosphatase family protein [Rhizobium/Agrobacterium group]MDH7806433.1 broad specificity phosphatase PhoE [Rhizobium sp. AN67]MDQ4407779.1 histidine phosphatase family protein [Rhizobium sp. AN63]NSZ62129.1 histidine phosphatase family protein [Agrobacterium tumefaciens]NTA68501.1 histidine phosphatase family protein [Agrobacterium tumefaciens]WIE38333.1 histidine phosphatase family protein [Agrobacterium tumefaciens]
MLVYVIRHGQTDWNAIRRLQGQKDIPLNDFGRAQAVGNGKVLAQILGDSARDFDYVASPLGRTRETMELMRGAMGLDPHTYRTDDRLVEVSFGDWEGQTLPELKKEFPDRVKARKANKWDFIPPGQHAESYEILSWRIGAWLSSVEVPTVCVCHGGVIRSIFRLVSGMDKDEASTTQIPQDRILKVEIDRNSAEWIS